MVPFHQVIAAVGLVLLCALAPAHAEKRVALVIGNGAYFHADKLSNPVNDARGMRDALAALGFDVTYGEDLDLKTLRARIGQFAGRVDSADVALVYFAGHGATFGDVPFVVPVDAEFKSLDEVPYQLVAVETLIGELRRAKGVRIAILDACRDNGAEQELKRSRGSAVSRGLAPMKNPSGLIVAYATQHGATAADSAGSRNSPFTAALLHNIATPGLDVKEMFFKVGSDVETATGGRQQPEISISMYARYALVPGAGGAAPTGAERAWGFVQNSTDVAVLDDYIRQFGDVPIYGRLARVQREKAAKGAGREPEPANTQLAAIETPPSGGPLTVAQERALKPKQSFSECADCPEMVAVPAGFFMMGSPKGDRFSDSDESPQHEVTIGKALAVARLHVTVDQFGAFVRATRHEASSKCIVFEDGRWTQRANRSWRDPGFAQEGSHPVVCVSADDARAYADWLAKSTGKPYRLLSEAEWEYAARARVLSGDYPRFWFGEDENALCQNGNGADLKAQESAALFKGRAIVACNDGYANTSPAGHYKPNAFSLHDMAGNAWQWTADCWHGSYNGAPADGSAWTTACMYDSHVVRGGSWDDEPRKLRAAARAYYPNSYSRIGFRVARTLISAESSH
jgi:formylglycine-generating enzyme required for sulfatase activity